MTVIAALLAALIGITLGSLGGGGAILTVPVFVYALHVPMAAAVPMSLLVIGTASALAAAQRWHAREFDPRRGLWFGTAAVAGAFAGARLGLLLSDRVRLIVFAVVVLAAAVQMWRAASVLEVGGRPVSIAVALAAPAGIGALTGVIGIGGGFLFVPALVTILGIPMREATGLSLMVITMNTLAGFAGHVGHVTIAWAFVLPFAAVVAGATLAGGALSARVGSGTLKRIFAVVLICVGVFVLVENLG